LGVGVGVVASGAAKQGAPLAMKGASFAPVSAASSYVAAPRPAATIASVAATICVSLTTMPGEGEGEGWGWGWVQGWG
jgi:hypothetical protein